ncbi:hypothetical protein [Pontibacter sp. G13]|nr:hypothetical protein [Pontibacter sp. G13]WNJ21023.1 hypothetical protein RJD25_11180 [Pontibacter sp. G13]
MLHFPVCRKNQTARYAQIDHRIIRVKSWWEWVKVLRKCAGTAD